MPDRIRVAKLPPKPMLIFDGDCGFCRGWATRWQQLTEDRVEYAPSQSVAVRFPEIPAEHFKRSVQFVETDGTVYSGAEAAFRSLSYSKSKRWPLWCYRKIPGFAAVMEFGYRLVADHRDAAATVTQMLWGKSLEPSTYIISRSLFLRALGAVYLIAFVSLRLQIDGLYGEKGILPVADIMTQVRQQFGDHGFWHYPTLCWFGTSDVFLHRVCDAGAIFSLLMMFGVLPLLGTIATWILYLSLVNVCPVFLGFQWDGLLLDAGLLAIFFSPWALTLKRASGVQHSIISLWMLRWLIFRLMFSSGVVKMTGGDPTWRDLTAMKYHYETQPLPTWTSWYMHQLPLGFHKAETFVVLFVELIVPLLIFTPRGIRRKAAYIFIAFQLALMATGNYAFFNVLTLALCIPLLDDGAWPLNRWRKPETIVEPRWRWTAIPMALVALPLFVLSGAMMLDRMHLPELWEPSSKVLRSDFMRAVEDWAAWRYHTYSAYGLFEVMTTERPEIIIEGSNDGQEWLPYEFKYKPGNKARRPAFIAPFQPRLDWQMWFASMNSVRYSPWVYSLLKRIHEGSEPVLALLEKNPFPEKPPKYLRAVLYDYHFTSFENQGDEKSWWKRKAVGLWFPEPEEQ